MNRMVWWMIPCVWEGGANDIFVSWKDESKGRQRGKKEEKEREARESHYCDPMVEREEGQSSLERLESIALGFSLRSSPPRPRMTANLDQPSLAFAIVRTALVVVSWHFSNIALLGCTPYSRYLYPRPRELPDEISRCSRRLFSWESTCLKMIHITMQSALVDMQITQERT
jgi:hypothetical protein